MRTTLILCALGVVALGSRRETTPPVPGSPFPVPAQMDSVSVGAKLFISYNCADCHGAEGSGLIGPSFQDRRWRYGGSAEDVFHSIKDGRPEGMPLWGKIISDDQIWWLVAYVRSLGAGKDVTTENFTAVGANRTGH
jgi:cytochrome c oxidase cbb3-type subunit III